MEAIVSFWNSLEPGMRCVLGFMIWLIVILMLSNSANNSTRRRPPRF